MTIEEFTPDWKALCEMWDKRPSIELMGMYFKAMEHLTLEQWKCAVAGVIMHHEYGFPKPAHLLEAIGMGPDDDAQAMIAMKKIEDAMRYHGAYASVSFDDPVIHMLIEHHDGGWPGLCALTLKEWQWLQKDWLKLYKAYLQRPVRHGERLIGIVEGEDSHKMLPERLKADLLRRVGTTNKQITED